MNRLQSSGEHVKVESVDVPNAIPFDAERESDVEFRESAISRTEEIKDRIDSLNEKMLDLIVEREGLIRELYSASSLISGSDYFFGCPSRRIVEEFEEYGFNSRLVRDSFSAVRKNFFDDSDPVFQDVVSIGVGYSGMDCISPYSGLLVFRFEGLKNPDLRFGIGFSVRQESEFLSHETHRHGYVAYRGQRDVDVIFGENVNVGRIYVHSNIAKNCTAFLMSSVHVGNVRAFLGMFLANPEKIIDEYRHRDEHGTEGNERRLSWDHLIDGYRQPLSNIILRRVTRNGNHGNKEEDKVHRFHCK